MASYYNLLQSRNGPYTQDNYYQDSGQDYYAFRGLFSRGGKDERNRTYDSPISDPNSQLRKDLANPLYIETARRLGITNFDSANDLARVLDALAVPKAPPPAQEAAKAETPAAPPAPPATPAPPETAPGLPSLMIPGVDVRLLGQQIGVKARKSKASQSGLTSMGTSRFTIPRPRSSGASSLNIG